MLRVEGLRVSYGRVPALEGEIVGLVGPHGSGKSTTLSAIFGRRRGGERAQG